MMAYSQRAEVRPEDVLDIRRHIQNLEFQVQKLRQNLDSGSVGFQAVSPACEPVSYQDLRQMIDARRVRVRYFDENLFGEPAWDMLLELYACDLAQMRMTTSNLCIAAAVPATTALRWIGNLDEAGLLQRENDPLDGRRVFVSLTDRAREALRKYFEDVLGH